MSKDLETFRAGGTVAVITGAGGGMGRVCARRMGLTHRLVLAEVNAKACEAEAKALSADGYDVAAAVACDISDRAAVQRLAEAAEAAGPLGALVHTAGVSPAFVDWEPILRINFVGTALLLDAFVKQAVRGSVAVCIASNAGHLLPPDPEQEAVFDTPLAPDVMARLEALVMKAAKRSGQIPAVQAYITSKRGVLRLVKDQVQSWAAKSARIVSISPGMILTPMGEKEADNPIAAALLDKTPAGRWGTAMDIANAVSFLCSPEASFITGADLLVDGGVIPLVTGRNALLG